MPPSAGPLSGKMASTTGAPYTKKSSASTEKSCAFVLTLTVTRPCGPSPLEPPSLHAPGGVVHTTAVAFSSTGAAGTLVYAPNAQR